MKKLALLTVSFMIFGVGFMSTTNAQKVAPNVSKYGAAVEGYDVVCYFSGKPQKGKPTINSAYQSATYYFQNEANKATFLANPAKYAPVYGGWCAYAMGATGEKVEVDPTTFKIVDGKLNLFYNAYFNNTLKSWNKDEANLKQKAEGNWAKLNH